MGRPVVYAAVEGAVDEAVARKLIRHVGGAEAEVYGKRGKAYLRKRMRGYIQAAKRNPWLVLVDLDKDDACAPPLRSVWLEEPVPDNLCFRVAVREVEAWLLADAEAIARFLGVAVARVPRQPEALDDPKAWLVDLAGRSRRREIREDMVPRPGSGRDVGPAYVSRMIEFAYEHWRPDVAAVRADSLRRAIQSLKRLV